MQRSVLLFQEPSELWNVRSKEGGISVRRLFMVLMRRLLDRVGLFFQHAAFCGHLDRVENVQACLLTEG
jgi:hypothetical protein